MKCKKFLARILCAALGSMLLPASALAAAPGVTIIHQWPKAEVERQGVFVYDEYATLWRYSDDVQQLVRQDGQVMIPYGVYDAFYPIRCLGVYREQAPVRFLVSKNGQYGVVKPDGSVVLPIGAYDAIEQSGIRENMVALKAEGDQYRVWILNRDGKPLMDLGLSDDSVIQVYTATDRIYIQNGNTLSVWDGAGTLCWQKEGYRHEPYGGVAAYELGVSGVYDLEKEEYFLVDKDGNFYAKDVQDAGRDVEVLLNGDLLVDKKEIWDRNGKRLMTVTDGDPNSAVYIDDLGFLNVYNAGTDQYSLLNWELEPVIEDVYSIEFCAGGLYEIRESAQSASSFYNAAGEKIAYTNMGHVDDLNQLLPEWRSEPYVQCRYFIAVSQPTMESPQSFRLIDAQGNILLDETEISHWHGVSYQNVFWAKNSEGDMVAYQLPLTALDPTYAKLTDHWFVTDQEPDQSENPIQPKFSDVPADVWYAGAVDWAVEQEIASGTSSTTFSPAETCTTAEILTFLWRVNGAPAPAIENPFTDVENGSWYADAALWAYEQGLVDGIALHGESPCTRSETVTYLWKLNGSPSVGAASFSDVSAEAGYAQAVAWAVQAGITSGTGDNRFSPDDTCTRSEIITFLHRDLME